MEIVFTLFKYFPYGGLQRDFLQIAKLCQQAGFKVTVLTLEWQGEQCEHFDIKIVPTKGIFKHQRYIYFNQYAQQFIAEQAPNSLVVGFNKMPGLDIYFAADPCYKIKTANEKRTFHYLTSRHKLFSAFEHAVFSPSSKTEILCISEMELQKFMLAYDTPRQRLHLLPPGILKDRVVPPPSEYSKQHARKALHFAETDLMLLQIGSGFKIKGLDRSLKAIHSLPDAIKARVKLFVLGQDDPRPFARLIKKYELDNQVIFTGGVENVGDYLLSADLLIHPAYLETGGHVLLEAMIAGLPVLTTDTCGYGQYVDQANAGIVLKSPFDQTVFNETIIQMLKGQETEQWSRNGLQFTQTHDIYGLHQNAADLITRFAARKQPA